MKISRRALLAAPALLMAARVYGQSFGGNDIPTNIIPRPQFGAIRWDPWYSVAAGTPGAQLAVNPGTLAPDAWHYRAPVHAVTGSDAITWGISQSILDAEIMAANAGGLDYWAFLRYTTISPTMDFAYNYYLTSSIRSYVKFCLIKQSDNMGVTGNFSTENADTLAQMQQAGYLTVLGNRPLFYIFYIASSIAGNWSGNIANFKTAIDAMRASVQAAGLGNPYVVCMGGGVVAGNPASALGADAYSNYVISVGGTNNPFNTMAASNKLQWGREALAYNYIPTCNVGFNATPLNDIPPSWWVANPNSVIEPTSVELTAYLQEGANFVRQYPSRCPANSVLLYAWSECAEGGVALMPTLGDPSGSKLACLRAVK